MRHATDGGKKEHVVAPTFVVGKIIRMRIEGKGKGTSPRAVAAAQHHRRLAANSEEAMTMMFSAAALESVFVPSVSRDLPARPVE